jgi:hypothetical protein
MTNRRGSLQGKGGCWGKCLLLKERAVARGKDLLSKERAGIKGGGTPFYRLASRD